MKLFAVLCIPWSLPFLLKSQPINKKGVTTMAFPTSLKVRTNPIAFSCHGNTQPFHSPATFGMVLMACNATHCENSVFNPA